MSKCEWHNLDKLSIAALEFQMTMHLNKRMLRHNETSIGKEVKSFNSLMLNGYPSNQYLLIIFTDHTFCIVRGTVDDAAEDYQDELTVRLDLAQVINPRLHYCNAFLELLLPPNVVERYNELRNPN